MLSSFKCCRHTLCIFILLLVEHQSKTKFMIKLIYWLPSSCYFLIFIFFFFFLKFSVLDLFLHLSKSSTCLFEFYWSKRIFIDTCITCRLLFDEKKTQFDEKKRRKKQLNGRFSGFFRFWPVLTGSIAYPVQLSDQTATPSVPGPTGRFGPVFKTLPGTLCTMCDTMC
jgi:hypothetical protein